MWYHSFALLSVNSLCLIICSTIPYIHFLYEKVCSFSGKAQQAADDLRERYGVEIFALAVNASVEDISMLKHLVGEDVAPYRIIQVPSASMLQAPQLAYTGM